jgi:hypothetical protein
MIRRLVIVVAVAAAPGAVRAEWIGRGFDLPNLTWAATHIVLVEDGKVVESWKGDLKPGAKLPDGAAGFARIKPPAFDPDWVERSGEKPPAVSGRRLVLFLAHVPRYGAEDRDPEWMGAACPGFPDHPQSLPPNSVAFVEGDRVYTAVGLGGLGTAGYALRPAGGVAGLREIVGLGLDLRARFAAAKADPDPQKRADRLAALLPAVTGYTGLWGLGDVMYAVAGCGDAGVPHLVEWATDPKGKDRDKAWAALCRTGDAGADAVLKFLGDQAARWTGAAAGLRPGRAARDPADDPPNPWGSPIGLYHLLSGVRGMQLSAANKRRVREHAGLAELDRVLATHPGLKGAGPDLEQARRVLRHLRAGEFRPDE